MVQVIAPGSTLLRTWPLQGGISAEMTAFELQRPDGQTRKLILRRPSEPVLRLNPRAAEDEFKVLQLITSLGLAAPTPYYLDQSGTIFSTPYLIMEYIDGRPEFPSSPAADFTIQLAKSLATIHSANHWRLDTSFLPKSANECVEISRDGLSNVDLSLDDQRIHHVLEEISPMLQRNVPVLLHGDYWPGNILWRDDMLVGVVDWEDAQLGDPLIDLAISRLDILWIFGTDALHSFTNYYQSLMNIDFINLPYWDLCAALRLARLIGDDLTQWTAFFHPYGRHDITEQSVREHFQYFVTQGFENLRDKI